MLPATIRGIHALAILGKGRRPKNNYILSGHVR